MNQKRREITPDLLRLIAAFGVVFIHLAPNTPAAETLTRVFSEFAVPFFLAISLYYFIAGRLRSPGLTPLSELKLDRLLVPYAFWSAIYVLMTAAKRVVAHEPLGIDPIGIVFYGGAAVHLYFIPLLILFQIGALAAILLLKPPRKWLYIIALAALIALHIGVGILTRQFGFQNALACGAGYIALGFVLVHTQRSQVWKWANLVFGVVVIFYIFARHYTDIPLNLPEAVKGPLIGYGISALALNVKFNAAPNAVSATLLRSSYGIYLAHFAFLEGIEFFLERANIIIVPYSLPIKFGLSLLICILCLALIQISRLMPLAAYVMFGEGKLRSARLAGSA